MGMLEAPVTGDQFQVATQMRSLAKRVHASIATQQMKHKGLSEPNWKLIQIEVTPANEASVSTIRTIDNECQIANNTCQHELTRE